MPTPHECTKPNCFYCYELARVNKTKEPTLFQISAMIDAAIQQLDTLHEIVGTKNRYSEETDKYIMENIELPNQLLAKNIGRTRAAVSMRKVYLRRVA